MPFLQRQLKGDHVSCTVETACGHCQAPIQIEIDSELGCQAAGGAQPLVYVPMVTCAFTMALHWP